MSEDAAVVARSLDGVMHPMTAAALKEVGDPVARAPTASAPSRPRHDRDARCGTGSLSNDEGERLSTVRYGRMPERNKATFWGQLHAEWQSLCALRPTLTGVTLADGAEAHWRGLDALALGLEEADLARVEQSALVDFYHAAAQLGKACDVLWGAQSVQRKAEFARVRTLRKEDDSGVDKVSNRLRHRASGMRGRKREEREKALTSCRNQRGRLQYAQYRRAKLPMGSGVVEAACTTLVTQRVKRSGMRWGMAGGQAMLTCRSVMPSERWERAWSLVGNDFRKPVTVVTAHDPEVLDPAA